MTSITKVLARSVLIPLDNPVAISNRKIAGRFYTLVRVECDDGSHGIGFCHGGTRTGDLAATAIRQLFAPHLIGQDPHRTEGLWQELYQDSLLPGRTGAVIRALSAVDNALWDRNARAAGLPLYRYLGAFRTGSVPAYASGGYYNRSGTPEGVTEEITTYVKAGFTAAKIKIGGAAPSVDHARVAAARAVLGEDGILMLDANNAWNDFASAMRVLEPICDFRPFCIEEPFGPDDLANHARLAAALPVAIAGGELLGPRWAHKALIEQGGVTLLQPDAAVCGGITEYRRIASHAASAGVAVAPHSLHHLHIHLVAATPNALFAEYFFDDSIVPFRRVMDGQTELKDGHLVLPETPGLGYGFDNKRVDEYAVEPWS